MDAVDAPSLLTCAIETLQFGLTNLCEFHDLKTAQTSCRIQLTMAEGIAIRCLSRKSQSSGFQYLVLLPSKLFGLTHLTQVDIHLCETQPGFRWKLLAKCLWLAASSDFLMQHSIYLGHKDLSTVTLLPLWMQLEVSEMNAFNAFTSQSL